MGEMKGVPRESIKAPLRLNGMRLFGFVWRRFNKGPWHFTSSLDSRAFPDRTLFVPLYTPEEVAVVVHHADD